MHDVDTVDLKIILELQNNGRMSNAELARKLGINVSTAAKRVTRMLAEDVITIRAMPNPYKMGYHANAFLAVDVDLGKINGVCDQLVDNFFVNNVMTVFGRYDLLVIVYFPHWEMLHHFVKEELGCMDGVKSVEIFIIKEVKKRYEKVFGKDLRDGKTITPDSMDFLLIKELVRDGRSSYGSLSEKLGTSIPTISRRISFLLKENIIRIGAVPNPSKLGYPADSLTTLTVENSRIEEICAELAPYSEVNLIMTMINGFDILVGVHFPNPELLYNFVIKKVSDIKGVRNIETFIRAEIKKRYYGWFLETIMLQNPLKPVEQ